MDKTHVFSLLILTYSKKFILSLSCELTIVIVYVVYSVLVVTNPNSITALVQEIKYQSILFVQGAVERYPIK